LTTVTFITTSGSALNRRAVTPGNAISSATHSGLSCHSLSCARCGAGADLRGRRAPCPLLRPRAYRSLALLGHEEGPGGWRRRLRQLAPLPGPPPRALGRTRGRYTRASRLWGQRSLVTGTSAPGKGPRLRRAKATSLQPATARTDARPGPVPRQPRSPARDPPATATDTGARPLRRRPAPRRAPPRTAPRPHFPAGPPRPGGGLAPSPASTQLTCRALG
jgi:hypothetical protein